MEWAVHVGAVSIEPVHSLELLRRMGKRHGMDVGLVKEKLQRASGHAGRGLLLWCLLCA